MHSSQNEYQTLFATKKQLRHVHILLKSLSFSPASVGPQRKHRKFPTVKTKQYINLLLV